MNTRRSEQRTLNDPGISDSDGVRTSNKARRIVRTKRKTHGNGKVILLFCFVLLLIIIIGYTISSIKDNPEQKHVEYQSNVDYEVPKVINYKFRKGEIICYDYSQNYVSHFKSDKGVLKIIVESVCSIETECINNNDDGSSDFQSVIRRLRTKTSKENDVTQYDTDDFKKSVSVPFIDKPVGFKVSQYGELLEYDDDAVAELFKTITSLSPVNRQKWLIFLTSSFIPIGGQNIQNGKCVHKSDTTVDAPQIGEISYEQSSIISEVNDNIVKIDIINQGKDGFDNFKKEMEIEDFDNSGSLIFDCIKGKILSQRVDTKYTMRVTKNVSKEIVMDIEQTHAYRLTEIKNRNDNSLK